MPCVGPVEERNVTGDVCSVEMGRREGRSAIVPGVEQITESNAAEPDYSVSIALRKDLRGAQREETSREESGCKAAAAYDGMQC